MCCYYDSHLTNGEMERLRDSVSGSRSPIIKVAEVELEQVLLTSDLEIYMFSPRSSDTQAMARKSGCCGYPLVPQFPT